MSRYGLAVDGCLDCTVEDNQITDWHPLPTLDGCASPGGLPGGGDRRARERHAAARLHRRQDRRLPGRGRRAGPIYRVYAGAIRCPTTSRSRSRSTASAWSRGSMPRRCCAADWDSVAARARGICPGGDAANLQSVWRALTDAQYGHGLPPDAADAHVRALLAVTTAGRGLRTARTLIVCLARRGSRVSLRDVDPAGFGCASLRRSRLPRRRFACCPRVAARQAARAGNDHRKRRRGTDHVP